MEGSIGFGLGAVMRGQITLAEGGQVEQQNFDNYLPARMSDMPEVEVEILLTDNGPTGEGEPGVPPIGPALANGWRRLTGQVITQLPFSKSVGKA